MKNCIHKFYVLFYSEGHETHEEDMVLFYYLSTDDTDFTDIFRM
ncbi:hypothetical protein L21SP3_01413 [Sedimentisphaera cyanobacteriorum]|uniref:Uncharacterized protein n=1 Tax=Sedimentisphaera cyanobacteriorum TaxID=1940790 RepID=A0A1Q2HQT9_9BACT|nr:hypothetical protein L21SP3_01413 [Sedimentisphaera cyanobacteriorum]